MVYVALLRGINVGGKSMIDMKQLKAVFEEAGLEAVRTYINSGNVIFRAQDGDPLSLAASVEAAIEARFGVPVRVLVRSVDEIRSIVQALPADWVNGDAMKCDVLFLWDDIDGEAILEKLEWDSEQEDVRYTPGAVLRCVPRKYAARSKLTRIVGTPLYQQITIRNCNTARKLLALMEE